jgi:hypothetical protein
MSGSQRPVFASDDWMHEQQLRAELEAEAWRRLRRELQTPLPPAPAPVVAQPKAINPHRTGSAILKGLVRFALAAAFAYLAYIAAVDSRVGEFEIWLAIGSTFLVTLALSMFEPVRTFVHTLAETARWVLIVAIGIGALWMVTHLSA